MRLEDDNSEKRDTAGYSSRLSSRTSHIVLTAIILVLALVTWSLSSVVNNLATLQALRGFNFDNITFSPQHPPKAEAISSLSSTSRAAKTVYVTQTVSATESSSTSKSKPAPKPTTGQPDRVAFAAFLAGYTRKDDWGEDMYYVSTRILAYQLLHDPETRSEIPFVVAVTPEVTSDKRNRLERDGVIVVPVEHIDAKWAAAKEGSYKYVLDKLQLFNFTEFDRILLMDADTTIRAPMADVFNDQAAQVQRTLHRKKEMKKKEAPLPRKYLLAAKFEGSGHATRRRKKRWWERDIERRTQQPKDVNYLNAGFFMFRPSKEIYAYYMSVLDIPGSFFPIFHEQSLLNYAHRRFGNMPWTELKWDWSVHGPSENDFKAGIKSLHAPLWNAAWPFGYPGERHKFWVKKRQEMEKFFANRE